MPDGDSVLPAEPADPVDPVDWDSRYVAGTTGWDLGGPVPLLTDALAAGLLPAAGTAFVPGAGRGYDAGELAAAGWTVVACDLSPTAAGYAAEHFPAVDYVVGDALDATQALAHTGGPVDLLWDHTFFCALPPAARPRVGDLARAVVRPGGLLGSGVFPLDRDDGEGPPYRYLPEDMGAVLGDDFELVHLGEPTGSMRPGWHRRLGIWRRR